MISRVLFTVIPIFSVFILLNSCGQKESEWQGTIEELDGVTVVNNPREGIWYLGEQTGVELIKMGQIGTLDGPEESLFVYISDTAVDSKGDIYISDRQLNEIRKFNKEGEHLLTLGRPGQGPGEFQSVTHLAIDQKDALVAFDGRMGRISIFSANGEHLTTTKRLIETSWIDPTKIFDTGDNFIIFGRQTDSLKLFHEFNKDWMLIRSYIDYEFIDNKDFEERNLGFNAGHCWFQDNGDLLYTKHYHDNQIFIYRNEELTKIILRESDIKKPYEIEVFQDVQKAMDMPRDKYDFRSFGQGVAFLGRSFLVSQGLYELSNGHIVHFVVTRISDEIRELGVEIYDSEGRLLIYSNLGENVYYNIRCKDTNDLFYAIDPLEYHKVITFRLDY